MSPEHEMELRVAIDEGLLSLEEAEALREEARRLSQSPLALLAARRALSEETLASLRRAVGSAPPAPLDGAPTLERAPTRESSSPDVPAFPVPGWERYQGVRFLGQGGMGQVFLAYDPQLHREVALKFVRGEDPERSRRFLAEARAQARVRHVRVCQVHEVGEVRGRSYIAMQYVDGQPLHLLAGQLTMEQKAQVLRDAAEGVHAAHRAGLIHRDLKPSNILVERREDGRLEPFVMDFGLARDWKEEGGTATGSVLGTPHYMAPEQARGDVERLDRRVDVYGLGATLYHLLTGQPPFPGANALEVLNHVATGEPRLPRALAPDVPAELEAIVLKCLEKERSERYDSAHALAEDLGRFLAGEPVQARSTGAWYRLRKKARKHRLVVGMAAVALLAMLLAAGWTLSTRQEAARRERLVRLFTERVGHIEALARYSGLSPLHDARADREELRALMGELEAEIHEAGAQAAGPGHYALGRGHVALGQDDQAREHLLAAWDEGFREPEVAWELALVLGREYHEALLEASRHNTAERRAASQREAERTLRDEVLTWLRRSQGADLPSPEYGAALLAFYEGRLDDALEQLEAGEARRPWFHELPLLRGDILRARAGQRRDAGDREGALADLEAGRRAYAATASIGESIAEVHRALAELEYLAMVMELYGRGDILPPFERGMAAVGRALAADATHVPSLILKSRFFNRLAEDRVRHSGDVEEALAQAIATAREALALAPVRAQKELAQSFWRRARYRQGRGQDPIEPLQQAIAALEAIPPGTARNYEYHSLRGLIFKTWADYEDAVGVDSLAHRDAAAEAFREAIRFEERLADAWLNLGITLLTRAAHPREAEPVGVLEEAGAALDKARTLNPETYVTWFLGGKLHTELALRRRQAGRDARPDLALAVELFQRGIAINDRVPPLHNSLGIVLTEQAREAWDRGGDAFPLLEKARAAYARAVSVAPGQGEGHNNLGEVHVERAAWRRLLGEDPGPDIRQAEQAYLKAGELLPKLAEPWANLARAHVTLAAFELEQGRNPRRSLERAREALHGALERNPRHAQAWQYQGEAHGLHALWKARQGQARAEDFDMAVESFEEALRLEPRRLDYRIAFGHFCREWALWRRAAGLDFGPALRRGLALVAEVRAARPEWADALLLSASLREALEAPALSPDGARAWREQARQERERALLLNPHLTSWWRRVLPRSHVATP